LTDGKWGRNGNKEKKGKKEREGREEGKRKKGRRREGIILERRMPRKEGTKEAS
jgi:hypothetical protein